VALLLAAAGKTASDFPADFAVGLTSGKVRSVVNAGEYTCMTAEEP
jgi:hypothetical protein